MGKIKDPNIVIDRSKEEILALSEEMAALRKEFEQLTTPQMVRDEMKQLAEVMEELDLLKGLKDEVRTLAGKVKEIEKNLQGGVKLGVLGLERLDSNEVNTSLTSNTGEIRGEKGEEGPNCEVMEEDKVKRSAASTKPLEVTNTKEVEAHSEVNNNREDDLAQSSTASKTQEDTKGMEMTSVGPSVETSVPTQKRVEVKTEKSPASKTPADGTKEMERSGVGVNVPTEKAVTTSPVVLNFVSVKPKLVKKKSK